MQPVVLPQGAPSVNAQADLVIDGEHLRVLDQGEGPAILLVHGFGGSTFSWRAVIGPLSRGARVIAVDLPGFGFSERRPVRPLSHTAHADRLRRLVEALGAGRVVLVGHSMGGGIAERLAAGYPGLVRALVLVAAVDAGVDARGPHTRRLGPGMAVAGAIARMPFLVRLLVRRILPRMVAEQATVTDAMVDGYARPLSVPGTVACLRRMARDTSRDRPVDLGAINCPTLVLSGGSDRVVPPATGERLAAAIPGARHVVFENTGHLLAEEAPERFLAEVTTFLASLECE